MNENSLSEKDDIEKTMKNSFVYLLMSSNGSTYVGATIDVNRRLRQHNSEIKGGAKRTTIKSSKGELWERVCYVGGFPDWTSALQFEWRWKQLSRKQPYKIPIERRINALCDLICLDKPTSKSIEYKDWTSPLTIYLEKPEKINKMEIEKIIKYANNIKYVDTNDGSKTRIEVV
jgi:predicted GIY-YIG superfamily endonuclease